MKKTFFGIIVAIMFCTAFTSCGNGKKVASTDADSLAVDTVMVEEVVVDSLAADTIVLDVVEEVAE